MLEVDSLSVNYGSHPAVVDVSLEVSPGQIVALVGPNGAGKTTLIRAISGVLPIQSGSIRVAGKDLSELSTSQRASLQAVVPQARQLPAEFTVWHTVLMGRTPYLGWLGGTSQADQERVRWALEKTHTLPLADRRIQEISGGEQQRVLLARALAQASPLLLLDEPTAHLDLYHQANLLSLVRKLAREQGLAVLMALHDLNLVSLFGDQVALMVAGRLNAFGSPQHVLNARNLSQAYQVPLHVIPHPEHGNPLVLPDGLDS